MNVAQGHLFGTIFEAILYGIYFTLFCICVSVFLDGSRKGTNKIIFTTMIVMFLLSTAHLAGTIRTMQEGFFGKATPIQYFNNKPLPLNLANKALYGTTMVVGDALLIYRLYVVWSDTRYAKPIIILPILTLMGTAVSIILLAWEFSRLKPGQTAFVHVINQTAPAAFGLPLITNVYITAGIVWRVKLAERSLARITNLQSTSLYRRVIAGTIESCIIYPIALAITLVLYGIHSNGQDILTGSMTQLIALVPTLMWLQVRFGQSRYEAAIAVSTDRTNASIEFAASPAYKMEAGRLDTLKFSTKLSTRPGDADEEEDYTLPR